MLFAFFSGIISEDLWSISCQLTCCLTLFLKIHSLNSDVSSYMLSDMLDDLFVSLYLTYILTVFRCLVHVLWHHKRTLHCIFCSIFSAKYGGKISHMTYMVWLFCVFVVPSGFHFDMSTSIILVPISDQYFDILYSDILPGGPSPAPGRNFDHFGLTIGRTWPIGNCKAMNPWSSEVHQRMGKWLLRCQ